MILPFLPGAPVAFSINGLEKPNLSSKFVYVIEMSLVPDREQSYGVYVYVCVYTCMHTQTHTWCTLYLLLCLSMSLYWKLLVHTNTCNSRSTPHFHLLPIHTPNSLLWYWGMWFSWYLLYLLIWPPVHDLFQNFPATLPPHRNIPLPFASNSSQQSPHFPGVDVNSTCLSLVYHYPPYPAWAVTAYLVRWHSYTDAIFILLSSDTSFQATVP